MATNSAARSGLSPDSPSTGPARVPDDVAMR